MFNADGSLSLKDSTGVVYAKSGRDIILDAVVQEEIHQRSKTNLTGAIVGAVAIGATCMFAGCAGLAAVGTAMGATAGTTTATVVGGMTIMAGAGAVAGNGTLASHSNTKWNDHNVALTTINADSIYMDAKRDVIGEGVLFFANNGGAITAGQDVNIESEKVTKYIKEKGWTVTGNVSLGGMLTNTDTINAAVRGGDVVGAMASSNPTFGAIYGLSKMDSPTDFTPLINAGLRADTLNTAFGKDLAIQQGAPLLGNDLTNTKNALSSGPSVSIGVGTHKSETEWTESYISQFNMGQGSMTVKSGRDITLVGTQIQAEGITLDAGQKLNVLADADYYKNRSSGAGVSVSYGASGWGFGVSGNHSKTDSTTYTNAGLNAGSGNLILKSGAEMNIIGANLDGKFIDVDAKGLLTVASVQNTSHSKNSSFGINVNQNNSVSMNGSRGSSDRSFTDNLTTILGTEGVRIHSDTGTVVEGALIANATKNPDGTLTDHGNLTVETPFLSWKDLEDIDVSKQVGGGINVSGDDGRDTSGTKTFSDVWDDTGNIDYRKNETIGVTKATLGNGTITITDPSKQTQDIATLNRDINNVQVITKESETHISVTVPLPDAIANPIGNAGGAVANGIVKAVEITVPATVEAIRNLTTSVTDKLVSDGKITADDKVNIDALAEGLKAGEISKDDLSGCLGGSTAFNLRNFLISPAYAAGCTVTVNGVQQELDRDKVALSVYLAEQEAKAMALARPEMATEYEFDVCLSDPSCAEKMEMRAEATMTAMTAGEGAVLLKGVSQAVRAEGLAAVGNFAKSMFDDLGKWFKGGTKVENIVPYNGTIKYANETKILQQMEKRGWTEQQIREAMGTKGISATGKNGSATRYVHPETGKSVVVDNATGEVFHVGGVGYKYD